MALSTPPLIATTTLGLRLMERVSTFYDQSRGAECWISGFAFAFTLNPNPYIL